MVTNARKESVCEANKEILELIWRLGRGVMYKRHIEAYMEHFFKQNPVDVWKKVKELVGADVVQRIRLHNIVVIKLKKYALRFLFGVDREKIRAIEVTASKLMRTAYVNAVMLFHLKTEFDDFQYQPFMDYYVPATSFFASRNQAHKVLSYNFDRGVMGKSVCKEIEKLKVIEEKGNSFKKQPKKAKSEFNINSMEQASVFLDFCTQNMGVHIAILDDKNNLTGAKIAEKMMKTYDYFHKFLPFGTFFKFTVYVRNENRLKALTGRANKKAFVDFIENKSLKQSITYHSQFCELNYVNLDMDNELFGNQLFVFAGNVHSRKHKEFESN